MNDQEKQHEQKWDEHNPEYEKYSNMSDIELQKWVERVSLTSFGWLFRHQAIFNNRLTSTGGRYFTKSHHIEISRRQLVAFGPEEVERIIKHELCHYHLHLQRRGYRHRDADFRQLLAQVGGSRYCSAIPGASRPEPYRYKIVCSSCGMTYMRKRRLDVRKFACGRCRGKLKLEELAQSR